MVIIVVKIEAYCMVKWWNRVPNITSCCVRAVNVTYTSPYVNLETYQWKCFQQKTNKWKSEDILPALNGLWMEWFWSSVDHRDFVLITGTCKRLHAENIDQWISGSVLALGADMWHVGMKLDTSLRLSCAIRSRCASNPSLSLSRDIWL